MDAFILHICINFCERAKNWKILSLDLGSFYLREHFALKESISIIILTFFYVGLNLSSLFSKLHEFINPIQDEGRGRGQKDPRTSFPPVTSTSLRISP